MAGRKNWTMVNMVRSMLFEKKVPKDWPEAINLSAYVLNRSPTVVVENATVEEAWSGIEPNVDYFRVFGCVGVYTFQVRKG